MPTTAASKCDGALQNQQNLTYHGTKCRPTKHVGIHVHFPELFVLSEIFTVHMNAIRLRPSDKINEETEYDCHWKEPYSSRQKDSQKATAKSPENIGRQELIWIQSKKLDWIVVLGFTAYCVFLEPETSEPFILRFKVSVRKTFKWLSSSIQKKNLHLLGRFDIAYHCFAQTCPNRWPWVSLPYRQIRQAPLVTSKTTY